MDLAVLAIHGMGTQDAGFAKQLEKNLRARYTGASALHFNPIFWADVLAGAEDRLWERVKSQHNLDFTKFRQFIINALGDAVAYQPLREESSSTKDVYREIHKRVAKALAGMQSEVGPKTPLVILAHSLGSIIISNYLWDLWRPSSFAAPEASPTTPFERGETLAGLVTFGCPLALWSLRYSDFGKPIPFPHKKLANHLPKVTPQWLNFFDQDDILAYPLREINDVYRKTVTADVEVSVGSFFTGWSPISHSGYWDDGDFAKGVAKLLTQVATETQ